MQTHGAEYQCAFCAETNHTFVDPSQGENQTYVEDCQVCCHPNELYVSKVEDEYVIRAEAE